jgi:hypothetical protein
MSAAEATIALAAAVALACSGEAVSSKHASPEPPTGTSTNDPALEPIEKTTASPSPPDNPQAAATPKPEPRPEASRFPPADFPPPSEQSAKPGDGKWVPLGDRAAGDLAAEPPHLLYRTVVHPHKVSKFIAVTVVAIDLTRAAVHLVAGTEDPIAPHVPKNERTGLIPQDHQAGLLAVFNGGYKSSHGGWGMMVDQRVFVPVRDTGCTFALYKDGSARIRTWPAVAATQGEMAAFRQTPPCLVEQGELHPDLQSKREGAWGGRVPNIKTRNRSAVGVDRTGRVLFYGFGDEAGPALLGEGMRAAGAFDAAQLDINFHWTRFLLFGKQGGELRVTSTLAPHMPHGRRGYVARPDHRDFFYVRRL